MKKVFIDGSAGTTGLRIHDRLLAREDIELITLPEAERKNTEARKAAINKSDITFLCLPDSAAIEAVSLVKNENTVIIDTSTAHRTESGWAYGYPELSPKFEECVINSKRIAVPGCHASGFITLVYPLIEKGILSCDRRLSCHSLTGYSGGGKKMIADYEGEHRDSLLASPRQYGIAQTHKHLKEMTAITGIKKAPAFCPIVADFYSGMEVTVPLFSEDINSGYTVDDIKKAYAEKYTGPIVKYEERLDIDGFIPAGLLSGRDSMRVTVTGNEDRILLVAVYDNLGKGASGAAVECLNLATGAERTKGLCL